MATDITPCEALIGADCKLYYNSATLATPTLVEIDEVSDVNIPDFAHTMAEIVTRSGDFAYNKPAKTRVSADATYLYRANDTVWQYLKGQFLGKILIDLFILDGPYDTDGVEGLRMACYLEQFPINQPLEEFVTQDTLRFLPGYACDPNGDKIDPAWVIMASGLPTSLTEGAHAPAGAPISRSIAKLSKLPRPILEMLLKKGKIKILPTMKQVRAAEAKAYYKDPDLPISVVPDGMLVGMAPTPVPAPTK